METLQIWAIIMLISSGLFTGAAFALSWGLSSVWLKMPATQFKPQFAQNLKRADRVQPLLLLIAIVSSIGYAVSCHGTGVTLSSLAVTGFILILLFSAIFMIPLQRRLMAAKGSGAEFDGMRRRWINGHYVRTLLAVTSFALSVGAVVSHL